MRRLTLEEASLVSSKARGDNRPSYHSVDTQEDVKISREFETYLILAPQQVKTDVSGMFQVVIDNDPNQVGVRSEVLSTFLTDEEDLETESLRRFSSITSLYDRVVDSFSSSAEGFGDVTEVSLLQESLTSSLGGIVHARDRHSYNLAVITVIKSRSESSSRQTASAGYRSWVRVLAEYPSNG